MIGRHRPRRSGGALVALLAVGGLLAVGAGAAGRVPDLAASVLLGSKEPARGTLAVSVTGSASRVVPPGTAAAFPLTVTRSAGVGAVELTATGLPRGVTASFAPDKLPGTGTATSTLTLRPATTTAEGRWPITVVASSGNTSASLGLTLVVEKAGVPFVVSGPEAPRTPLAPGVSAPLNLAISNPSTSELRVRSLVVTVTRTSSAACPASGQYVVGQYTGAYPLTVPAGQTRTLAQLGVPASAWPQLRMLDLPTNQDGCKGATVLLAFSGSGDGGTTA